MSNYETLFSITKGDRVLKCMQHNNLFYVWQNNTEMGCFLSYEDARDKTLELSNKKV